MKLVVDNVSELPIRNLSDIGGMARGFADDLDKGEWGDLHRAVVILQGEDGSLVLLGWGENSGPHELMGIFEAAKLQVFADSVCDD